MSESSPEFREALARLTAGGRDAVDDEILHDEGSDARREIESALRKQGDKVKWRKHKRLSRKQRRRRRR